MQQYPPPLSDPRVFASTGLDRLGAVPLRAVDPRQVGPFRIIALLGGGGMGRIYLGRDAAGAPGLAAVKVIRPEYADDAQFRLRFEREAAALARVSGEQAAVLLGTGFDGDLLWMATDYIPGLNLSDAVRTHGPLDAAATWRLAADLGQAVGAMERVGVVHRDVKPSNVILGADGSRVIDFGISQAADTSAITTTGQQVGTPAYMSPEQVRGLPVAISSDVFALGSVLAYALTGNAPFGDGTSVDVLHRVAFEPPKEEVLARVAGIDADLALLIAACLDKDAEQRPTPAEVVGAAMPRQVAAPWSETLSGEIMSRVQVALSVQQLPLGVQAGPDPVQHTVLLGGAGPKPVGAGYPAPTETATPLPAPLPTPTPGSPSGSGSYRTLPTVAQLPGVGMGVGVPMPPAAGVPLPGPAGRPQRRRNAWLIGGAVAAVAAIATVTVLLAGSSPQRTVTAGSSPGDGTASAAGQGGGFGGSLGPSASASASTGSSASASGSPSASASASSVAPGAQPSGKAGAPQPGAPGRTGAPGGAPASTPAGGPAAPPPTPRPTPSPAGPPAWDQACQYYSGNTETDYGQNNSRVVELQCLLTHRGYSVGASGVDGQFGPDTRTAVEQFQTAKGLQVDGQVGVNTWAALRSAN
ncbi:protein kinase [Streptacidiphilus sp. EB129]|uniref:protein kinase domain-containing protein n=1 Tax=Streptacidiphilus sp. EB129 TaxID=3156262 RepID=UPI0035130C6B